MKKLISALLIVAMLLVGVTACGPATEDDQFKIGFIMLHDENSTYDLNFINAAKDVQKKLGLTDDQVIIVKGIPEEGEDCYNKACELAEDGCDIVFADSFGHEDNMIRAAKDYPDVQFCHATGTKAHTEGVANFHNAFASIYEGRYLAGIAAGMKLNEMIADGKITADQAKIGYVGAMPYAEVKSGMTSFFLGARSVCKTATIDVKYTNSWYNYDMEKEYADQMIKDGCVLISQHADSMGAPDACEAAGVPNVSYNGSTAAACPNTFLVSSRINWAPYYEFIIDCVKNDKEIPADWTGSLETGSVELSDLGTACAEGTAEAIADAKAKIISGELEVFSTSAWTKDGQTMTSYMADVNSDANFEGDTEVIKDGAFLESEYRSAPYFDIDIDGVTTK
ncbi:MAG: BMP family ABC transporter substrate-binding protein [Clostridia bacterium]|nr:BMP family ABC transporter substrate-binding protein [Clostridia bacterium]